VIIRQTIAAIIIKLFEKGLSAICNKIIAIYESIGQGIIGKKAHIMPTSININQIIVRAKSIFLFFVNITLCYFPFPFQSMYLILMRIQEGVFLLFQKKINLLSYL